MLRLKVRRFVMAEACPRVCEGVAPARLGTPSYFVSQGLVGQDGEGP